MKSKAIFIPGKIIPPLKHGTTILLKSSKKDTRVSVKIKTSYCPSYSQLHKQNPSCKGSCDNLHEWKQLKASVSTSYVPTVLKNAPHLIFHITYSSPTYPIPPSHWHMVYHTPYSQVCSTLFDAQVSGSLSSYAVFLHLAFTSCAPLNIPFCDHALYNSPCLHCSSDGWLTLEAVVVPLFWARTCLWGFFVCTEELNSFYKLLKTLG